MRRSARRSQPAAGDSGQIRLDFSGADAPAIAAPPSPGAAVLLLERGRRSTPARSAAEWFEAGCELEATSPAEAERAYRRALEADDQHADAHLNLGCLLHEAGDLAGAERHYARALELEPDGATAAFNLGVVLEDLRRAEPAIAAYERAMAADPDFLDAYHNAVRLHEERGDKAAALRVLKRLRERNR
jgi:tetratricopeptide (TPR) repeat protein